MIFPYIAYGLRIHSNLPLPELITAEVGAGPDVVVRLGSMDRLLPAISGEEGYVDATTDEAYLFWQDVGAFLVRNGSEIIVDPLPGVDEQVTRLFLLGSALGVLLHQRGLLALHASAVALRSRAVVFVGDSGWGKSTTAAALHARGHNILADDLIALDMHGTGAPSVLPGFPRLKLSLEPAAALGYDLEKLAVFHPEDERRDCRVSFQPTSLPLACIYVLDAGSRQEIELLRPQQAFIELIHHSYAIYFLKNAGATPTHFRQCSQLAGSVPIYRLKRQPSLSVLPEIARLVEEHVGSKQ